MLKMVTGLASTECEKYDRSVGLFMLFLIETINYTIRVICDWSDHCYSSIKTNYGNGIIIGFLLAPKTRKKCHRTLFIEEFLWLIELSLTILVFEKSNVDFFAIKAIH